MACRFVLKRRFCRDNWTTSGQSCAGGFYQHVACVIYPTIVRGTAILGTALATSTMWTAAQWLVTWRSTQTRGKCPALLAGINWVMEFVSRQLCPAVTHQRLTQRAAGARASWAPQPGKTCATSSSTHKSASRLSGALVHMNNMKCWLWWEMTMHCWRGGGPADACRPAASATAHTHKWTARRGLRPAEKQSSWTVAHVLRPVLESCECFVP